MKIVTEFDYLSTVLAAEEEVQRGGEGRGRRDGRRRPRLPR